MLKTISIIIPIYNVESYLRKCLDSIIGTDISWGSAWGKLYKKSVFERFCFSENISWAEGFDLMYKLFLVSHCIVYLHKAPYCYRDRGDSASKIPGEEPIRQSLKVSEVRLLPLALAGIDLTEARKHHIGLLQWMKYNMGIVWDMSDTSTYKKNRGSIVVATFR